MRRASWEAQQRSRLTTIQQRLRLSLTMGVLQYARSWTSEVVRNSAVERGDTNEVKSELKDGYECYEVKNELKDGYKW